MSKQNSHTKKFRNKLWSPTRKGSITTPDADLPSSNQRERPFLRRASSKMSSGMFSIGRYAFESPLEGQSRSEGGSEERSASPDIDSGFVSAVSAGKPSHSVNHNFDTLGSLKELVVSAPHSVSNSPKISGNSLNSHLPPQNPSDHSLEPIAIPEPPVQPADIHEPSCIHDLEPQLRCDLDTLEKGAALEPLGKNLPGHYPETEALAPERNPNNYASINFESRNSPPAFLSTLFISRQRPRSTTQTHRQTGTRRSEYFRRKTLFCIIILLAVLTVMYMVMDSNEYLFSSIRRRFSMCSHNEFDSANLFFDHGPLDQSY
ncbi:LAFE_0F01178g1_1 [Lachancea fermentati]|uniref:LAFE_0F01178g1_1 n=1 Tax=Lachancea fermentati TaxID=4955 RepID=A0A1G4MEJ9_LACFM|nr:LAFE_0F01178g1_1 [Lachancea fermentati]